MSMKKEKPGKTKVTKENFDAVHVMHRGGVSAKNIALALNLNESTVYKILRRESYEAYRKWKKEENAKIYEMKRERRSQTQTVSDQDHTEKKIDLAHVAFGLCMIGKRFYELASEIDEMTTADTIRHQFMLDQ